MLHFRMSNGTYSRWLFCPVFLLIFVCGRCLAEHCHPNELEQCMEHVKPIMQNVSIGFAANSEQLDTVCKLFTQGMECIDRFVKRCFQETQRQLFRQNMAGVKEVMTKLCTDGEYRKEYLSHASCFLSVAPQYEECGGTFRNAVGVINQNQEDNSVKLPKMCSALHRFLECAYGLTSQHCGERGKSASEFLRTYTEKAVGSLVTSTCRTLPNGPGSQNQPGRVIELTEAEGLREVNVEQDTTTMRWFPSTRPSRASRRTGPGRGRGEGRRNKSTMAMGSMVTTSMRPDAARSQQQGVSGSPPSKKNGALLSRQSLPPVVLSVSFFIISCYRWTKIWT